MTCYVIEHGFICGSFGKTKRLHVGNRYYWLEEHSYFGPVFWEDRLCSKELDLCYEGSENHPIWKAYEQWKNKSKS